jgi:hypothetical protein
VQIHQLRDDAGNDVAVDGASERLHRELVLVAVGSRQADVVVAVAAAIATWTA